ncbi:MAG: ornithine cyclodeaminase family protein [Xanthomonadales bacterium]|nr:ornithine cyclodeaminase family protein [Xanthomonadales bacterium]
MKSLPYIDAAAIAAQLSYPELLAALEQAFLQAHQVPDRMNCDIGAQWGIDARLLLMPAWRADGFLGIKCVTLHPDNPARGMPALAGLYLLLDGKTGQPLALLDAAELTAWRTAAASMLAASLLATRAPRKVLVIGAGKLAAYFIRAYWEIMQPERIGLWNRDISKAEQLISSIQLPGCTLEVAPDLEQAVRQADSISTLTSSRQPLFPGRWCRPGCHVDLVGGFAPDMREADDELLRRAVICVDSYQGALAEAGDIIDPLERGVISRADIKMELSELVTVKKPLLSAEKDLTVFKSVGTALEDLAAAVLICDRINPGQDSPCP